MNERGFIAVKELTKIIDEIIENKLISPIAGEEILFRVQAHVDGKTKNDTSKYKTPSWKYGSK